jgi:hypothetical protein
MTQRSESSPSRVKNFLFPMPFRPALGSTQPPIQWVLGALSPGLKRPGREVDHSPPTSSKVKKMWIYTSTPPYVFRDNFTLLLTSEFYFAVKIVFSSYLWVCWPFIYIYIFFFFFCILSQGSIWFLKNWTNASDFNFQSFLYCCNKTWPSRQAFFSFLSNLLPTQCFVVHCYQQE